MTTFKAEVRSDGKMFNPPRATDAMRKAYRLHLIRAGLIFQGEVEPRTPFGVTGKLRRGWITEMESDTSVAVYNSEEYALPVELGRRPGKGIPLEPLRLWTRRVLGITEEKKINSVAYLISRKAKLQGIDGQFFARDSFRDATPEMNKELQKMGASIVKGLQQ